MNPKIMEDNKMRKEYNFSNSKPNPYIKKLRKQISIRIDIDKIDYFKRKAEETRIKYQNLINLYLSDCAINSKNVNIVWK
jgi:uncharacterized protein (DUF4415 family)